jgi:hypothetical protein
MERSAATSVGKALNDEVALRKEGEGSAARENTLRKFGRGKHILGSQGCFI